MIDHQDYKFVPFPLCQKGCPLTLSERLVCGSLVGHTGKGLSVRRLSALVGLGRHGAQSALTGQKKRGGGLVACGLAVERDDGWHALEPTGTQAEWFHERKAEDAAPWNRRIAYFPCCVPSRSCPLATTPAALVWLASSLQRHPRPSTAEGLAGLLGVDPETASAAIWKLAECGVMSWTRGAGGKTRSNLTFADPLPAQWSSWWVPRHKEESKVQDPAKSAATVKVKEVEPAEGLAPVPPAVQPPPKVLPATKPSKQDPAGLPDWVRLDWLGVMEQARIREGDRPKVLRLVERHWRAVDDMAGQPLDAVEHIQSADDDHDPQKSGGRRDCGGLLLHRLAKSVAEAEQDRRFRQHEQNQKATAFAPLEAAGLARSNWWPCRTCGEQKAWSVGYVEENHWPDEVRECVATVRAGGCVSRVHVGSVTNLCSSCRAAQPGLVVSATRDELVGRQVGGYTLKDRVIVQGYRHFPDAAVEVLPVGTVDVAKAENECAEDWLMALGPPPA